MQKRDYCPVCYKHLNAKYISQHCESKHPEVSKIDLNARKWELRKLVQVRLHDYSTVQSLLVICHLNNKLFILQAGVVPPTPWNSSENWWPSGFRRNSPPDLNDLSTFSMEPCELAKVIPEDDEVSMLRQVPYQDEIRSRVNSQRLMRLVALLN
jgi:hypothetical protein